MFNLRYNPVAHKTTLHFTISDYSERISNAGRENHRSNNFIALFLAAQELDQREGERERRSYSMTVKRRRDT